MTLAQNGNKYQQNDKKRMTEKENNNQQKEKDRIGCYFSSII